jgi:hypothetical protein
MLCVVLTGMGVDARDGARAVKQHGGTVYSQDAATATIYGMPAAVAEAGLTDGVFPLHQIAAAVLRWCEQAASLDEARTGRSGGTGFTLGQEQARCQLPQRSRRSAAAS